MDRKQEFTDHISAGYSFKGDSITIGSAMLDGEALPGTLVKLPLSTMNRHGLVSGATGTGKTKTVQILAENLSRNGVPSLLMDIKGDLSGIAMPGTDNKHIQYRHGIMGVDWEARGFPVEFLTLSEEKGVRLRATVSEFGPVLFSKILELNDTQSGIVSLIFKYCDDHNYPLLDLKDFRKAIQYLTVEGKEEIEREYGRISTASTGAILRKIVALEQQGADIFFGEKSFDTSDLLRKSPEGMGMISVLRLSDIQDRPKLFSTFMLSLLAEIYSSFPEEGDMEKPKLVFFIDEAHLIFEEASKALLDQIETVIKLIRSKGVGIIFCTQNPADVPDAVLGQLGLKIQHALRAFTARDRKDIKLASENYPLSTFYKTDEIITGLGIGEALITALNDKGIPTPLAATLLRAPSSRMDVLTQKEIDEIVGSSEIKDKYNAEIDRESAYEILTAKIEYKKQQEEKEEDNKLKEGYGRRKSDNSPLIDATLKRQVGRTIARELTRGLLGVLGLGGRSGRRKSSSGFTGWF